MPARVRDDPGPMPLLPMCDQQIQVRTGRANGWRWAADVLPLLTDDDPLGAGTCTTPTHAMPLGDAPKGIREVQAKEDGMVKALPKT